MDLGTRDALVVAVEPLDQVLGHRRLVVADEPGELGRPPGPVTGTRQGQTEGLRIQPPAQRLGLPDAVLRQLQIGDGGVPTVGTPLGLAVPDDVQVSHDEPPRSLPAR